MPDFNPSAAGLPQLQAPTPTIDIANQMAGQQAQQQLQQTQSAALGNETQNKQRQIQLSMLQGVLTEPDPEKQRDLINKIVPMANSLNPSFQIDPSIGVPEIRALVQSQRPLENVPDQNFINNNQGFSPVVKEGLQTGTLSPKDVLSAQASNPFLDVGNFSGTPINGAFPEQGTQVSQAVNPDGTITKATTSPMGYEMPSEVQQKLSTLPPNMQPTVKAIIEGRLSPPNPNSRAPGAQALMQAVTNVDPNFDYVNAQARQKTRTSFTAGPDAANITALNTAIPHLIALKGAYDNLGNGSIPLLNSAENAFGNAAGNSKTQANTAAVSTDAAAVSHELAKVFRSSGMSEGEIKDWESKISTSASPAQSDQIIQSALDLMQGRLQALGDKYNQGMGTNKDALQLLSPSSQAAVAKLRGNESAAPSQQQNATPNLTAGQTIYKGHLYAGGDPSQPSSWKALSGGASGSY